MKRRETLKALTAAGISAPFLARTLAVLAGEAGKVTPEMIERAEWITGLTFTDEDRELMLDDVNETLAEYSRLRAVELDNSIPPAVFFDPAPSARSGVSPGNARDEKGDSPPGPDASDSPLPDRDDDLAFASLRELSSWLRRREISSRELTRFYLDRLAALDPHLHCVISTTEERALDRAERADREIAAGAWRGPLHGIPWGAKDLLAVPGYRTTWGAEPYKDQVREETATVVHRLDAAGAVLAAKLTVGALAWGDVWFGGKTRNPWNLEQGSSGSSAGPAAATGAGLVAFAIGTETWGSIVSPSTRCGVSGLRPTFGRVSRHGCMALSWSMDKIGPMARSLDDCAWIFRAIAGADGLDPTARDAPFRWPRPGGIRGLRVGYVGDLFEEDRGAELEDEAARADAREWAEIDRRTLRELEDLGVDLVGVRLPGDLPVEGLSLILTAEAATAFDDLTRSGRDDELVRQEKNAWPNVFRQGQLVPAVEYLRANRIRTLLQREMEELFSRVDVYVSPTYGGNNLLITNLTGHPQVVLPNGFRTSDGTPTSITFTGSLLAEEDLLALGRAYQEATGYHRKRPRLPAPAR